MQIHMHTCTCAQSHAPRVLVLFDIYLDQEMSQVTEYPRKYREISTIKPHWLMNLISLFIPFYIQLISFQLAYQNLI